MAKNNFNSFNSKEKKNKVPRIILLALLTLAYVIVISTINPTPVNGYLGPRYGKREQGNQVTNEKGRIGIPKSIVSRSVGSRFYAGTRYAGKRNNINTNEGMNYGQSTEFDYETYPKGNYKQDSIPPQRFSLNNNECLYLPNIGIKCSTNSKPILDVEDN